MAPTVIVVRLVSTTASIMNFSRAFSLQPLFGGQVAFHPEETIDRAIQLSRWNMRDEHFRKLPPAFRDFLKHRRGGGTEMKTPDAPVSRIGTAFDKSARFQAIDQPGYGDRLDLDEGRQLVLRHSRLRIEPNQDHPLRPGHAVCPRPGIGAGPH